MTDARDTKLFLFDIDGTLIRSFLREGASRAAYDDVELLPGRREKIGELVDAGHRIALVTNQGGVAMGYQDPMQVCRKIAKVLDELELPQGAIAHGVRNHRDQSGRPADLFTPPVAYVSFCHPRARLDRYRRDTFWRKPGPGMLLCAMLDHQVRPDQTLFVGDMASDLQAADDAGIPYEDALSFFEAGE